MTDRGFSRREKDGVPFYVCRTLEEIPDLRHGFSTRAGGAGGSSGCLNLSYAQWDPPERVDENRRRFLSAIGADNLRLATLRQIHSDRIHVIKDSGAPRGEKPQGDALAASIGGVAVAVQVADCYPVLIADPLRKVVAAVHAGWRGILIRILSKTVSTLVDAFGCRPSSLLVAIGPGIRSCCYEVGREVVDLFRQGCPDVELATPSRSRPDKYLIDLAAALHVQAREAGIEPARIFDLRLCTCCGVHEFFSYRRDGAFSGRMMGVIARLT
ncbi:MAG: peptidoglycan editing factor PgeF [Acidobacteria bacterium]|nr:peptidoglycan editing factor PgeF [Acidobacteriota bacterium]